MAGTGELQTDPLFVGLTRPPMFFGVSYMYTVLNAMICMLLFINTERLMILFVGLPILHGIGYFICFKEPLFIELFMVKMQRCNKCRNKFFHGANSYDMY
ncbi:MAG: type secretion system protein VirB3 [Rickettsiales bacterium]|jgi:type IV secretion system protein VirB3|nr:type secretion system protein VirB3 [Rickettsiales bacterium]